MSGAKGEDYPMEELNGSARNAAPEVTSMGGADRAEEMGLTTEIMEMFAEAQENIMELNQSRVDALEQLQLSRARIGDLEEVVFEVTARCHHAEELLRYNNIDINTPLPGEPGYVDTAIVIEYHSRWPKAYLHFRADGGRWTEMPGVKMESMQAPGMNLKRLEINAKHLEFVVHDGQGHWDKDGSGNYVAQGAGTFELKGGRLRRE
eukprot:CAMPEP_0182903798 /NCGR_PEP_ID=MMETSP0034_2-20130328/31600_1 /TAXON_ID=156128 /ORGANISM="Nephroselmis pyriformis, Strain CCMP717" /LENGTH=205 /DNA_ID=CAMNT_0025038793 /DNA_START=472 /DNA_END=1089 /DNA_ORIENTATION=-